MLLIFGAVLGIAWILDRGAPRYFSSPDEVRAAALVKFNELFFLAPEPIPDLTTVSRVPEFVIDDSDAEQVSVSWTEEESSNDIAEYGDRIDADPKTQSFVLPNGQVIRLVGIAYSPKRKKLFDEGDPERWGSQEQITWYDPVLLQPIADPQAVGLEADAHVRESSELLLAFDCSDREARPVRWHWLRLHDERTMAVVANSSSRQTNKHDIMVYQHRLNIAHNTALRILLPISYGEPEVKQIDPNATEQAIRFGGDAVEFSVLYSRDGYQGGSSSTGRGIGTEAQVGFRFRDAKPGANQSQSFSVVSVWPQVQGNSLQYLDENKKSWRNFYPNNVVNAIRYKGKLAEMGPRKWRRFPKLARGVFELKEIPGLPELKNLFKAEVGPVRFEYDNQFREAISGPTLLQWGYHKTSIPRAEFPIVFDDPRVTPGQLLAEYEKRIGIRLDVDDANHTVTGEGDSWLERVKKWGQRMLRRIFP
jgi:hypothetical protein